MKKISIATAILVSVPLVGMAQQSDPAPKTDTLEHRSVFSRRSRIMSFRQMDQRKIYSWANGQRSTPTGREAGRRTSGLVRVFDDSAVVVGSKYERKEREVN